MSGEPAHRLRRRWAPIAAVAAEGGPVWTPGFETLTEADVQEAHALGLSVLPWTVNQPADMRRLIAWGVDGLISDSPIWP